MIDPPIESHLWFLLYERDAVTLEDVCWWDSGRAQVAILAAGLYEASPGVWMHGRDTAEWFEETMKDIRHAAPTAICACREIDGFDDSDDSDGFDAEAAPAAEEPPAPAARGRAPTDRGAAHDQDPTPIGTAQHVA